MILGKPIVVASAILSDGARVPRTFETDSRLASTDEWGNECNSVSEIIDFKSFKAKPTSRGAGSRNHPAARN